MNYRNITFGIIAAAVVTLSVAVDARSYARWEYLGSKSVKLSGDRDVIFVGAQQGGFRKLQVLVSENGVFFESMVIQYANGTADDIPLRFHIPAGGRSRLIDLRGGDRFISQIEFRYRAERNGRGRARVEVFGRR